MLKTSYCFPWFKQSHNSKLSRRCQHATNQTAAINAISPSLRVLGFALVDQPTGFDVGVVTIAGLYFVTHSMVVF